MDVVFTNFLLTHLVAEAALAEDPAEAIKNYFSGIFSKLKPGGKLIMVEQLSWDTAMDISQIAQSFGLEFTANSRGVLRPSSTIKGSRRDIYAQLGQLANSFDPTLSYEYWPSNELYGGAGVDLPRQKIAGSNVGSSNYVPLLVFEKQSEEVDK